MDYDKRVAVVVGLLEYRGDHALSWDEALELLRFTGVPAQEAIAAVSAAITEGVLTKVEEGGELRLGKLRVDERADVHLADAVRRLPLPPRLPTSLPADPRRDVLRGKGEPGWS